MKITTHIKNCIFILLRNNSKEIKNINTYGVVRVTKTVYKRKGSWIRNQVALLIRRTRKEYPYKIKDYSKAKELYESRTPINLSAIKPEDYVVKFSIEEPIKGERWCEYYINKRGVPGVYKVKKWDEKYGHWSLEDYRGYSDIYGNSISEDSSRSFCFATEEDIETFKNLSKEYEKETEELTLLEDNISKLRSRKLEREKRANENSHLRIEQMFTEYERSV